MTAYMKTAFIEKNIRGIIADRLGIPVLFEVPEVPSEAYPTMPERFIVLERLGLSRADRVYRLSLAVQSISTASLDDAATVDEYAEAVMEEIAEKPYICAVDLSSSYNHTDTASGRYRMQSVYEIYYID